VQAEFSAKLWAYGDEPGSWHFVTLPVEVADELRDHADSAGPRRGFGSIRVSATIGSTTWQTSLFPDTKRGSMLLPVKKLVRVAEDLEPGDSCMVTVEILD
jgi:hypothetical protein